MEATRLRRLKSYHKQRASKKEEECVAGPSNTSRAYVSNITAPCTVGGQQQLRKLVPASNDFEICINTQERERFDPEKRARFDIIIDSQRGNSNIQVDSQRKNSNSNIQVDSQRNNSNSNIQVDLQRNNSNSNIQVDLQRNNSNIRSNSNIQVDSQRKNSNSNIQVDSQRNNSNIRSNSNIQVDSQRNNSNIRGNSNIQVEILVDRQERTPFRIYVDQQEMDNFDDVNADLLEREMAELLLSM